MSHSTPPDDPTEILKALFRHIESQLQDHNSLTDPDTKKALQEGLAALTGRTELQPEMSILEGGRSESERDAHSSSDYSETPTLAIHDKIEAEDSEDDEGLLSFPMTDFQLDSGAQVSVHIVNADEMNSLFNPEDIEHGQISLSEDDPTQTILFAKDLRHVRIYCTAGRFEVSTEDGLVDILSVGQSVDVEAPRIFVSAETQAEGHYVMLDAHRFEW